MMERAFEGVRTSLIDLEHAISERLQRQDETIESALKNLKQQYENVAREHDRSVIKMNQVAQSHSDLAVTVKHDITSLRADIQQLQQQQPPPPPPVKSPSPMGPPANLKAIITAASSQWGGSVPKDTPQQLLSAANAANGGGISLSVSSGEDNGGGGGGDEEKLTAASIQALIDEVEVLTKESHKYTDAMQILDRIISNPSRDHDHDFLVWKNRAVCLMKLQHYQEAVIDCDRALAIDRAWKVLVMKSQSLMALRLYADAVPVLEEAIRMDTAANKTQWGPKLINLVAECREKTLREVTAAINTRKRSRRSDQPLLLNNNNNSNGGVVPKKKHRNNNDDVDDDDDDDDDTNASEINNNEKNGGGNEELFAPPANMRRFMSIADAIRAIRNDPSKDNRTKVMELARELNKMSVSDLEKQLHAHGLMVSGKTKSSLATILAQAQVMGIIQRTCPKCNAPMCFNTDLSAALCTNHDERQRALRCSGKQSLSNQLRIVPWTD